MNKFSVIVSILIFLSSCSCFKNVPREEIHYAQKDSIILKIVDSIRYIPVERYVDIVHTYDTLKLETSLASSTAFVDTNTHTLKGKIENKKGVEKCYKIVEKYIEKCDTIYVKVPVTVEVEKPVRHIPNFFWGTLVFTLLTLGYIGLKIYLRISAKGLVK